MKLSDLKQRVNNKYPNAEVDVDRIGNTNCVFVKTGDTNAETNLVTMRVGYAEMLPVPEAILDVQWNEIFGQWVVYTGLKAKDYSDDPELIFVDTLGNN